MNLQQLFQQLAKQEEDKDHHLILQSSFKNGYQIILSSDNHLIAEKILFSTSDETELINWIKQKLNYY